MVRKKTEEHDPNGEVVKITFTDENGIIYSKRVRGKNGKFTYFKLIDGKLRKDAEKHKLISKREKRMNRAKQILKDRKQRK